MVPSTDLHEEWVLEEALYGNVEQVAERETLVGVVLADLQHPAGLPSCLELLCLGGGRGEGRGGEGRGGGGGGGGGGG